MVELAALPPNRLQSTYLDADSNSLPEGLRQGLCLGHLKGKDLRRCHHGKRSLLAERLGHAHGNGSLASSRLPSQQDSPSRNLALSDHLQDDPGRLDHVAWRSMACISEPKAIDDFIYKAVTKSILASDDLPSAPYSAQPFPEKLYGPREHHLIQDLGCENELQYARCESGP